MRRTCLLLVAVIAAGCGRNQPLAPVVAEPPSVLPHMFVLGSIDDARLPALDAVVAPGLTAIGVPEIETSGPRGDDPASVWNRLTTELGRAVPLPPPAFSRAYALTHVAIHDALSAARGSRRDHLHEDVVAAAAASTVLEYLFPAAIDRIREVVEAQIGETHGSAWRLGVAVGALVVEHGRNDGSSAVFTGPIPTGPDIWTGTNPVLPLCGTWRCWIIESGDAVQPEPPYPFGSEADLADVAAVATAAQNRTAEQTAIVHKWGDISPPAIWNGLLLERVAGRKLGVAASARAFAFLNVAMYDAFVSCWRCKYTFWTARPLHRIPGLVTVIPTPNFPSYTSGHSTISAAAAVVMGELFPAERRWFASQAEEAAMSRLWGGIHFPHDNEQGLIVGRKIGATVVRVMRKQREDLVAQR